MSVHPTAIIGKNVSMGQGNEIGANVFIEDNVRLGSGNKVYPGAYIAEGTEIGNNNQIHMHAVIGHAPQDLAYQGVKTKTIIGNNNIIREFVTIHRGTKEGTQTTLGNENFLMAYVHLAHNCQIANKVIMVNNATLGGYVMVEDGAFISGMVVVHQFTRIGRLALISGLSAVNKDVPPFTICGGRASIIYGLNAVGLRRAGIEPKVRSEIKQAFKLLYRSDLNVQNAVAEIERIATTEEVKHFLEFIKSSKRGISRGGSSSEAKEYAQESED